MQKFLYTGPSGFYIDGYTVNQAAIYNCDASLSVNSLVMASNTISSGVELVTDNTDSMSVLGYVIDKPTDTTASVLTKGVITGLTGLTKGGVVYLGISGGFTTNKPTSGYMHRLGQAIDSDKIDFDPAPTKIKLVYVPQLNPPLSLKQTIVAPSTGSYFGWKVDYDGKKAVVTEYGGSISAYVYSFDGTSLNLDQTLNASYQSTCAIKDNIIFIGEPYYDWDYTDEGRINVYTFDGTNWTSTQVLVSPTPSANGNFGIDLDIYNNKLVVGERGKGYIHVYDIANNNTITYNSTLTLPTTVTSIGASVAITDTFIATGYYNSIWIFKYDGSSWNLLQTISDPLDSTDFGYSLSFYDSKLLIGEPGNNKAYVYSFNGTNFVLEQDLTILTSVPASSKYGYSVYLYKNIAIVGAYYESSRDGAVYLYEYDGSSWLFSQKLSTAGDIDNFGLDVVAAGSELIVTADGYDASTGAIYLYK